MTSEGGSEAEPTLADVLAAINAVARVQSEHGSEIAGLRGTAESLRLDFAAHAELAQARHVETQQTLEGLAQMAHAQQVQLGRVEARLTSRLEDVQRVVQAVKADLAAHLDDPDAHHGHAA